MIMEQTLRKFLIEMTKKYKINKNDNFLYYKDNKTYLCKMLSDDLKVSIDTDKLDQETSLKKIAEVPVELSNFLERLSTIGYRNKEELNENETLSPRISVIYRNKQPKLRVYKLSPNQSNIAKNVMSYINQEVNQKKKATITIR
jgi:hypothetical protein